MYKISICGEGRRWNRLQTPGKRGAAHGPGRLQRVSKEMADISNLTQDWVTRVHKAPGLPAPTAPKATSLCHGGFVACHSVALSAVTACWRPAQIWPHGSQGLPFSLRICGRLTVAKRAFFLSHWCCICNSL